MFDPGWDFEAEHLDVKSVNLLHQRLLWWNQIRVCSNVSKDRGINSQHCWEISFLLIFITSSKRIVNWKLGFNHLLLEICREEQSQLIGKRIPIVLIEISWKPVKFRKVRNSQLDLRSVVDKIWRDLVVRSACSNQFLSLLSHSGLILGNVSTRLNSPKIVKDFLFLQVASKSVFFNLLQEGKLRLYILVSKPKIGSDHFFKNIVAVTQRNPFKPS